jgi:hypothetical protein
MVAVGARSLPQSEASAERVRVFARPATGGQRLQPMHVPSPEDDIFGFEGSDETCDHVRDVTSPLPLSHSLQRSDPHVVLVGALPVREVAELHRLDDAIDDHGRPEAGSQPEEEQLSSPVAAQGLHGRVVDELDGTPECAFEVEADPAPRQVVRLRHRPTAKDRAGVADRRRVETPARRGFQHSRDHLLRGQCRPGCELPRGPLARGQDLDVRSAHVDHQHSQPAPSFRRHPAVSLGLGLCQRPSAAMSASASFGPQLPRA